MILTSHMLLTRAPNLVTTEIDDELIMMNEEDDSCFGLNSVGHKIWNLLETPQSHDVLLDALCTLYQINHEQCKQDVEPFIDQMVGHHLIARSM